ncbi:MAG: insulinase family protein, partial [Burkholderiales bacterium]|nr:insulinase family protein [Burkholderiales bacterium]
MPPIQLKFVSRIVLVALTLQCSFSGALAQGVSHLPQGVQVGPQAEGVSEYRLANGLKVVLFPDPSKASTTVNVTYRVGSREENYGETGMAHLLEHLLFKGTPQHKNIPQEMGKRGMQFNATTDTDHTNYFESFSASEANLA